MTQPKVPTGEPTNPEALAGQLSSASLDVLKKALDSLTTEQRETIESDLQSVRGATRVAAQAAVTVESSEVAQPAHLETAPKLYSIASARDYLIQNGIDLKRLSIGRGTLDEMDANSVLGAEVKSAMRWGLVDRKNADSYGATLEGAEVSIGDLQAVVAQLKKNPNLKQRIVLGVDSMTPDECWTRLIADPITRKYVWNRFSKYKRVDPATRRYLEDQSPSGKAGMLFTPDQMNLPADLRNISANDQLKKMTNGQRYMGPVGWMRLFRQGVDRALLALFPDEAQDLDRLNSVAYKALVNKALLDRRIDNYLLDTTTGTQFPDFRLDGKPNGAVPDLVFDPYPDDRKVRLNDYDPDNPDDDLGGRPVLGSFLS